MEKRMAKLESEVENMQVRMQGFEAALGCMVAVRQMKETMKEVWKLLDSLISHTGRPNEEFNIRTGMIQSRNKLKKTLEDTGNW